MTKKLLAFAAVAAAATLLWGVGPASAHHPDVVATTVCPSGTASIKVDATAWVTDWGAAHRVNNKVRIDLTGAGVNQTANGSFAAPDFTMSRTFAVPASTGQTLNVRVTAVDAWGPNGEYGSAGTFSETTVTVQPPCPGSTTTTTRPPSSTTTPPSTSAPVTSAPATTVPVEVGGITELPADNDADAGAVGGANGPSLAFTGADTVPMIVFGVLLLAAGVALVRVGRRNEG
jgi:hypothetical protein